jgi:hypothetical protein
MKTDQQRIARYRARMSSTLVGPAMGSQLATMATNYEGYLDVFYQKQQACAQILNEDDIDLSLRFGYQAFNNQVFHATETLSDEALQSEACILYAKYVSLGFDAAELDKILVQVWNLLACTEQS